MWKTDFSLAIKTERPFELEFNNALISGSIDLLKRDSVDESILEVIDFKTGKPNSDLAEKYDLQIQLYTIAAREALGLNTKKALVHYLDDEKNQRVEVITSTYAMKNASEQIGFAIGGITTASFKRDARRNQVCKNCDFCDICPKRSGFKA
jgi:DNA helicase-2/ATP-dependent DNA helicase PcrA